MCKPEDIRFLREALIKWFRKYGRDFPWRKENDPYRILIAELMLQRTQARQVIPVYKKFMEKFPDPYALYRADDAEIAGVLKSLGLRWRIRLFLNMRRILVENFGGTVPFDRELLRTLPGVSNYICSVVRCVAFKIPDPPLDTNTVRIAGRFFSLEIKDASRRSSVFRTAVSVFIDPDRPHLSAPALIDLGSTVCRATGSVCRECPLSPLCSYAVAHLQHM